MINKGVGLGFIMCKHLLDKMCPENNLTVVSGENKGTTIMFLVKHEQKEVTRVQTKSIIEGNLNSIQPAKVKNEQKQDASNEQSNKMKLQKKSSLYVMASDHIKQNIENEAFENNRENIQPFQMTQKLHTSLMQQSNQPKQIEDQFSSQEFSNGNNHYSFLNFKQEKIFYTPESLNNIKLHPHFDSPTLISQLGQRESIIMEQSHYFYGNNQQQQQLFRKSSFFDIARNNDFKQDGGESQIKELHNHHQQLTTVQRNSSCKNILTKFQERNRESLVNNNLKTQSYPLDASIKQKLVKNQTAPQISQTFHHATRIKHNTVNIQNQEEYLPQIRIQESIVDCQNLQHQHFFKNEYHQEQNVSQNIQHSPKWNSLKQSNQNQQQSVRTNYQKSCNRQPSIKIASESSISSSNPQSLSESSEQNQEWQYKDMHMNENKHQIKIYSQDMKSSLNFSNVLPRSQSSSYPQSNHQSDTLQNQKELLIFKHINLQKLIKTPTKQQQDDGLKPNHIQSETSPAVTQILQTPPEVLDTSFNNDTKEQEDNFLTTNQISQHNFKCNSNISAMNSNISQFASKVMNDKNTATTLSQSEKQNINNFQTYSKAQIIQQQTNTKPPSEKVLPQQVNSAYHELVINIQQLIENKIKKILIVDDNPFNILCLQILLKKFNFLETQEAHDGKEAVDKIQDEHFDLILMDVNMPIMDGLEATAKIKEMVKNNIIQPTKVFIVTAFGDSQDKQKAIKIGADAHICKPMTLATLYNELKHHF